MPLLMLHARHVTKPDLKRAKGEDVGALFGLARPFHMPRDTTLPGKRNVRRLLAGHGQHAGFRTQHNKSHGPTARAGQLLEIVIQVLGLDKALDFIPGDSCRQSSLLQWRGRLHLPASTLGVPEKGAQTMRFMFRCATAYQNRLDVHRHRFGQFGVLSEEALALLSGGEATTAQCPRRSRIDVQFEEEYAFHPTARV